MQKKNQSNLGGTPRHPFLPPIKQARMEALAEKIAFWTEEAYPPEKVSELHEYWDLQLESMGLEIPK